MRDRVSVNLREGRRARQQLFFTRNLLLGASAAYLIWWFVVQALLPNAFNPFLSRITVVILFLVVWVESFISKRVERNIQAFFGICACLLTLHYFYLFHFNNTDINWVVGCYITVIAVCACLQNAKILLYYTIFTLLLSVTLIQLDPLLKNSIFLTGIITIFFFANFGVRSRLKLLSQLEENSDRYHTLFDSVFEGVIVHEGGFILEANQGFSKIFTARQRDVINSTVMDYIAPSARHQMKAVIEQITDQPVETIGIKSDGTLIDIEFTGKRIVLEGRELTVMAFHDITVRKKAEKNRILYEASQEALRIRDEFITIASHELKTPLTAIKLQAQMAKRAISKNDLSNMTPERLNKLVDNMDRQSDRLTHLVEDMLDISRISMGKFIMQELNINFSQITRDVLSLLSESFTLAHSQLSVRVEDDVYIKGDAFRIEQLLMNLFSNAIKYGNEKSVEVELVKNKDKVVFSVTDHGKGISPEQQQRIFDRFERAVSSRDISGMGLGLFISKQIVEAHRGKIEVQSEVGQGARFVVSFPASS
jgi:PAS domain S-box-containing protein